MVAGKEEKNLIEGVQEFAGWAGEQLAKIPDAVAGALGGAKDTVGVVISSQNREAWNKPLSEQEIAAYQALKGDKNFTDVLNGAGLLALDPIMGSNLLQDPPQRARIALIINKNVGDLQALGGAGAAAAVAAKGAQNIGGDMLVGLQEFGGSVMEFLQQDMPLTEKLGKIFSIVVENVQGGWKNVQAFFSGNPIEKTKEEMVNAKKQADENIQKTAQEVILERAANVKAQLLEAGFDKDMANTVSQNVLTEAKKAVETQTPFKLNFSEQDLNPLKGSEQAAVPTAAPAPAPAAGVPQIPASEQVTQRVEFQDISHRVPEGQPVTPVLTPMVAKTATGATL
jgi:hypothetical protein